MKTLKNFLSAILLAMLLMSFLSCKKDTVKAFKNSKVQAVATTLNSFADPLTVSLYAGVETHDYGNLDGPRLLARFASPHGIAAIPTGAVYISDVANHSIRKISPEGVITTIPFKLLANPYSMTTAGDGSVYFLEAGKQRIRRITKDDQIQPPLEICKIVDGIRTPYVFNNLFDFAVADDGTIYLVDVGTHSIIKRATNGIATILAGGTAGYNDGNGLDAQFNTPTNIAVDSNNNLYVTDVLNFRIRKITPGGIVTTLAGSTQGFTDGVGSIAQFKSLQDVIVADSKTLLVADAYSLRSIDLTTNQVNTIAGSATSGYINGPPLSARFSGISQITINNNNIYASEEGARYIRKISPL